MDITWKRAANYTQMARQGVTCGTLRQDERFSPYAWTLECWMINDLHRERAKDIVSEYLRLEFEAWAISFYRSHNMKPGHFMVRFHSNVL